MPRRTMTSASSGRVFSFDWDRPTEPTPDDLNGLFAQGKIQFEDKPDEPPSVEPPQSQPSPAIVPPSAHYETPGDGRSMFAKVYSKLRDTAYGGPESILPQIRGVTAPALPEYKSLNVPNPPPDENAWRTGDPEASFGQIASEPAYNAIRSSSSMTGVMADYLLNKAGSKIAGEIGSRIFGRGTPDVLPPAAPPPNVPKALPPSPVDAPPIESVLGSSKRDFVGSQAVGDMRPPTRFYQGAKGTADVKNAYPKITPPVEIPTDAANSVSPPRPTLRPEEAGSVVNIPADVAASNVDPLRVPPTERGIVPPAGKYQRVNGKFVKKPLPSEYQTGDTLTPTANEYYAGTGGVTPPKTMAEAQAQAVGGIKRSPPVPETAPQPEVLGPDETVPVDVKNVTPGKTLKQKVNEYLPGDTMYDKALNVAGEAKAIKASVDLSAPLRQGFFTATRKEFYKALPDMVKSFGSEETAQAVQKAIQDHPNYELMKQSGLAIGGKEESFAQAKLAERLPLLGNLVKASDRSYTTFLTKVRADVFNDIVEKAAAKGIDKAEVAPGVADWVNITTGRGGLGRLEPVAREMNATFFSPRFASSRIQLLGAPAKYVTANPTVRKEIIRDMLGTAGIFTGLVSTAALAGAEVSGDPRSADFGKVKLGNTRVDLGAGMLQYIRLGAILASGQRTTQSGKTIDLKPGVGHTTRYDAVDTFRRSKMSPVPALVEDWLRGEDFNHQPFSATKEVRDLFVPMVSQDILDVIKDDPSLAKGLGVGALATFGAGVQTYKNQPYRRRAYQ